MSALETRHLLCGFVATLLVSIPACEAPNDLGRYCFVGAGMDLDAGLLDYDPWNNPDCLTGLCLKQPGYRCEDGAATCPEPEEQYKIQSICTHGCETSADCTGSSDNVNDCQNFVCQRSDPYYGPPVPCHCVCLDYIRDGDGIALTRAAFDASDLACMTAN